MSSGQWRPQRAPREELTDGDLRLRRWRLSDVEVLHSLIEANVGHLRPWMSWIVHEPVDITARRSLLKSWEVGWRELSDFPYLITVDDRPAGSAGLHLRQGRGVFDIGYWVDEQHIGRGVATRCAQLLAREALSIPGVNAVEIHHDVYNIASSRVAEKAGFVAVADYEREPEVPDGGRVFRRWVAVR